MKIVFLIRTFQERFSYLLKTERVSRQAICNGCIETRNDKVFDSTKISHLFRADAILTTEHNFYSAFKTACGYFECTYTYWHTNLTQLDF